MAHLVFECDSLGCAALFRNLCFSWRRASFVTLCSSHSVLLCVRDSSTEITSRRENTQRDSQYVWICSEEDTHTHTPLHPYTLLPGMRSVSLFAGVTFQLLPAHAPYKTRVVASARRGLLTSTRGDSVVSPGETASITTGLCETLNKTKHTWLLLRNLWKRCPSSRGNASVGQSGWPFTEWMLFLKHVCKIWSSNYYYFFSSNKKKWSVQHSV